MCTPRIFEGLPILNNSSPLLRYMTLHYPNLVLCCTPRARLTSLVQKVSVRQSSIVLELNIVCNDDCPDRDHVPAVLRESRNPVRGPNAQLGGHATGPGRLPRVDAVVRRSADNQHVPAVGDQAQESDGDA